MGINNFEGTVAYFVISRLAGGEILENYTKDETSLQPLLEYSLSYLENFETLKNDVANWEQNISQHSNSLKVGKLNQISFFYQNLKVFFVEIKEDDIFVVGFFNNNYPDGIIKLFWKEYIDYVRQNYSF